MKKLRIQHEGLHRLALVIAAASFVILPSIIYMNMYSESFWDYWSEVFDIIEDINGFVKMFPKDPFANSFWLSLPFISIFVGYGSIKVLEWVKKGFN
tara:strand:+ start:429 stop:719 length:291 start_codon:yes stop_codon:yes gene_type:complete